MHKLTITILGLALVFSLPGFAGPVLVSENPWGANTDTAIMDIVFGAGNYTFYGSYGAATPASVFTSANTLSGWKEAQVRTTRGTRTSPPTRPLSSRGPMRAAPF